MATTTPYLERPPRIGDTVWYGGVDITQSSTMWPPLTGVVQDIRDRLTPVHPKWPEPMAVLDRGNGVTSWVAISRCRVINPNHSSSPLSSSPVDR